MKEMSSHKNAGENESLHNVLENSFISYSENIVWMVDENLNLIYSNKNFNDYFSYNVRNERINFAHKLPEEIMNVLCDDHLRILDAGVPVRKEISLQTADGKKTFFYVHMFPAIASKKMVVGQAINLGNSFSEKEQLQETIQRLLRLVQTASNAIWEWDIKNGKTFRNKALLELFGNAGENTNGLEWWLQQIHPDDYPQINENIQNTLKEKKTAWSYSYRFKCKNAIYRHISDRGFIFYENGTPVKMIGSLRDVTDVKLLEVQLEEERLTKQKEISENVIKILERERTLIGYELHDNINQILAVTLLYIGQLNPICDEQKKLKAMCLEQLNEAIGEIRNLSQALVIPFLKKKGLVASITELIERINFSKKMEIQFNSTHRRYPISSGKKVTLFRIIQEQLSNIMKYSQATNVQIVLSMSEKELCLVIEDNGIGFNPGKKIKGIGLSNIHERTLFYNGTVDIKTAEGKGCKLIVRMPCD